MGNHGSNGDAPGTNTSRLAPYIARAEERASSFQTTITVQYRAPIPGRDTFEPMMLGSYSIIAEVSRRRWLLEPHLVQVGPYRESPGTVARDYLQMHYPRWKPERWATRWPRRWVAPQPFVPMAVRPVAFERGTYLDVRACWWTVLVRFGWGSIYVPGRYLGHGPSAIDFPFGHHKTARNSLVSSARYTVLLKWTPAEGYHHVERANPYLHIPLLHLIHDAMHILAAVALDCGAVYVHTDGYIAPNDRVADRIRKGISDLGFEARIKAQGAGWVKAVGDYRVGSLVSGVRAARATPLHQVAHLEESERTLLIRHLYR